MNTKQPNLKSRLLGFCAFAAILTGTGNYSSAETYHSEPSHRTEVNLGDTYWKFTTNDPNGAEAPTFDDSSWENVGVPHSFNDTDSFRNARNGGNPGQTTAWYRKEFQLSPADENRKILIEFQGVHVTSAVYVNGQFIPNTSEVEQPGESTHQFGFTPFVVDVTDLVKFDGSDNVLAVRVSNQNNPKWSQTPGFGTYWKFGMGLGGIFREVLLHITDEVYVPLNVYAGQQTWGTYVATVEADDASATIRMQTNVANASKQTEQVSVTTKVVDADHQVVLTETGIQAVPAGGETVFDFTGNIQNPTLWYPAQSPYGTPYMYRVYHIVQVGGKTVDVFESPLGIRTISWDKDYPFINGKQHEMFGWGIRYDYPALGSGVPVEQHWRDVKLGAEAGGRFARPGHNASCPNFVEAADAYGVMIAQPSGDQEFKLFTQMNPTMRTYKKEFHRDIVIRDRNHPSILMWETDNGGLASGLQAELKAIVDEWDHITPRVQSARGPAENMPDVAESEVISARNDAPYIRSANPNVPAWNAEAWLHFSARQAWDAEIDNTERYLKSYSQHRAADCFGYAHWYLAETQGESRKYAERDADLVRALGCSMMDGSRIPRLIYKAAQNSSWIPFEVRPGVVIGHHWNRSGTVEVKTWSNCPEVRLTLNGKDLGVKTPDAWDADTPYRAVWEVEWQAGTLIAEGLDANGTVVATDQIQTAGAPEKIVLKKRPAIVKPNGETFEIKSNGVDAAFLIAQVVDANGIICPEASDEITFEVEGEGIYRGGWNQYVYEDEPISFHSPGDPNLFAEAGQIGVAVRSTFHPGTVTVTATAEGLDTGTLTFETVGIEGVTPPEGIRPSPPMLDMTTPNGNNQQTIRNIAPECDVRASSEYSEERAATQAIDQNKKTYWQSDSKNQQWYMLHLSKNVALDKILLKWGPNFSKSYRVQFCDDLGYEWRDVYSIDNENGKTDHITQLVKHGKPMVIRFLFEKPSKNNGFSLNEIEIYTSKW